MQGYYYISTPLSDLIQLTAFSSLKKSDKIRLALEFYNFYENEKTKKKN